MHIRAYRKPHQRRQRGQRRRRASCRKGREDYKRDRTANRSSGHKQPKPSRWRARSQSSRQQLCGCQQLAAVRFKRSQYQRESALPDVQSDTAGMRQRQRASHQANQSVHRYADSKARDCRRHHGFGQLRDGAKIRRRHHGRHRSSWQQTPSQRWRAFAKPDSCRP